MSVAFCFWIPWLRLCCDKIGFFDLLQRFIHGGCFSFVLLKFWLIWPCLFCYLYLTEIPWTTSGFRNVFGKSITENLLQRRSCQLGYIVFLPFCALLLLIELVWLCLFQFRKCSVRVLGKWNNVRIREFGNKIIRFICLVSGLFGSKISMNLDHLWCIPNLKVCWKFMVWNCWSPNH